MYGTRPPRGVLTELLHAHGVHSCVRICLSILRPWWWDVFGPLGVSFLDSYLHEGLSSVASPGLCRACLHLSLQSLTAGLQSSLVRIYVLLCPVLSPRLIASDWSHHLLIYYSCYLSCPDGGRAKSGTETLPVCCFWLKYREDSQLGHFFFFCFFAFWLFQTCVNMDPPKLIDLYNRVE